MNVNQSSTQKNIFAVYVTDAPVPSMFCVILNGGSKIVDITKHVFVQYEKRESLDSANVQYF